MNPRRSEVAGATGLKRRIIRRGLPFGEKHVQGDGKDRGLLGVFICASLKEQFEFVMSEWTNRGAFAAGLSGTKDPIHGNNSGGSFEFDTDGGPQRLSGLAQFVTCKGAAYCLLPSLPAIDYLADVAANGHG
jgi:deferrochelatase/peroxidase EfeB